LSESLSTFGIKGMSPTNLRKFREFYQNYKIQQALPAELDKFPETMQNTIEYLSSRFVLGWTHYVTLMTVKNDEERRFYEIEAAKNGWGYRELERQINSALFERLVLSRDKNGVKELSIKGQIVEKPADIIKNPYILEFTGLEPQKKYTEHELETAIIDKLELFNQDLGQMQMYVNYFDRYVKTEEENPTVGILLCLTKSDSLVELTLPKDRNIYASNYQLYLPSKEELKKQIEEAEKEFSKNK